MPHNAKRKYKKIVMSSLSELTTSEFEEIRVGGCKGRSATKRRKDIWKRKKERGRGWVKSWKNPGSMRRRFYGGPGWNQFQPNGGSHKKARRLFAWSFVGGCFAKSWERPDGARGSGAETSNSPLSIRESFMSTLTEAEFLVGPWDLHFCLCNSIFQNYVT